LLVTKRSLLLTVLIVLDAISINAQEKKLSATLLINSKDQKQSLVLYQEVESGKPLEGYFAVPNFTKAIYGEFKEGGFNFLDPKVWGDFTRTLINKWTENKFPVTDIETMTNGFDMSKALSFFIDVVPDKKDKSVIGVAPKFALFSSKEKNSKREYDLNYDVDLFYKLFYTQLGKLNKLEYFNVQLPNYNFQFQINEIKLKDRLLTVNASMYEEIQKSLKEQSIESVDFDFNVEHGVYPPKELAPSRDDYLLSIHKQSGFEKKYFIAVDTGMDTLKSSTPIYYAKLNFPFTIYNEDKSRKYVSYKTKDDILKSTYEFIVVPIALSKDSLTLDLIVRCSKINLEDGLPRWAPFKKRLVMNINWGAFLELPKENWSAVFTRKGDYYEVYGYSDYERYILEIINLSCKKK
jgi:hypothetical protein